MKTSKTRGTWYEYLTMHLHGKCMGVIDYVQI